MFALASDPFTFEEANKSDKWRTAMNNEIEATKRKAMYMG